MFDFEDFPEIIETQIAMYVSLGLLAALVAAVIIAHVVMRKKNPTVITTRDITYGAICLAISFALGFMGVKLPQGGRITPASNLAIMVYCYYFGFRKGAVVCAANVCLQFLQGPSIYHPLSVLLDYVLPYMALIFLGIFRYKPEKFGAAVQNNAPALKGHVNFFIGAACYIVFRYVSHVLSGALLFGEYAWDGWSVWPYSFAYNAFFLIDAAVTIVAAAGVLSSKAFNRFMTVPPHALQNPDTAEDHD